MSIGLGIGLSLGAGGAGETPTYSVAIGSGPVISGTELTANISGLQGGETVTYQWTDDGVNITGATASTYTAAIGTDGIADASLIRCVATIDGTPYTSNAREIRYAEGTAPAVADGQTFTVDDTSVNLDGSASGANLTFSYALSGAPSGVTINASTGLITGTPTAASTGTATITATDQYGRTLTDTWTWTASLRTQATATNLAAQSYTVDDDTISLDFASQFTANGNTLTYTITGLPTGGVDDGDGTASGTPTVASQSGTITCTGTDEYGRETTSTATFTTALRTQATAAGGLGPFSFTQDEAITNQDLSADFTTNGNTLTYTVAPALPAGLSLASNGILSGTPTTLQTATSYTVTGQDEYGRDTDSTFTIAVVEASAFTPADLFASAEEGIWLDPSDLTTMWTDVAGTTQATVGDAVARIDDKSGNGNNLTQATVAHRPILRQDGSGNYYLEFDGSGDVLDTASGVLNTGTVSVMFAGENTNSATHFYTLPQDDPTNVDPFGRFLLYNTPTSGQFSTRVNGNLTIFTGLPTGNFVSHHSSQNADIRANGSTVTVGQPTQTLTFPNSVPFKIEASAFYGIVAIDRTLTAQEISDTEDYLADKAGVTL